MTRKKMGLLVMAYGTPYRIEELESYYTHIRHGRKPSAEMIENLRKRYEAIGGISPLAKITLEQAEKLEEHLNQVQNNYEFKMYLGLKHTKPFIEDAVKQMNADGIEEAVSIVLAPHFSTVSVKSYNGRAIEEADKLGGPQIKAIESWYQEPKFISYWAEKIKKVYDQMPSEEKRKFHFDCFGTQFARKNIAAWRPLSCSAPRDSRFDCQTSRCRKLLYWLAKCRKDTRSMAGAGCPSVDAGFI